MRKLLLFVLIFPFAGWSQLSGTYTIGPTDSDYTTIQEVVTTLTTQGISGPVVFNFKPGTYDSYQQTLNNVPGTSTINTITFQSEDFDYSNVIINGGQWTIKANNCIFQYLEFKPFSVYNTSNVIALNLEGNYCEVNNSRFHNGDGGYYVKVKGDNIKIANNLFEGYPDIVIYSFNPVSVENLTITGNTFSYAKITAIDVTRAINLTINKNNFAIAKVSSIRSFSSLGTVTISSNIIQNSYANNTNNFTKAAIDLLSSTGDYTVYINNNFINTKLQNLVIHNFKNVRVFNNNFKSDHNGILLNRFSNATGGTSYQVKNNVFYSAGQQNMAVSENVNFYNYISDYNAFNREFQTVAYTYGYGNFNVSQFYSLQQWKTTKNKDVHSKIVGFVYNSETNLHTQNSAMLNNAGVPVTNVLVDIDEDVRSTTTPDIGADEFEMDFATFVDIELVDIISPTLSSCEITDVLLSVKNNGGTTVTSLDIATVLNGLKGTPINILTTINPGETVDIAVPNFHLDENTFYEKISFLLSNPNGVNDNDLSNDSKFVSNVIKLGDFKINVERDNCGTLKSLNVAKLESISFLWSNGETTSKINTSTPGTYSVILTNTQGCTFTKSIIVN